MSNKRDLVKEAAAQAKNMQVDEIHSERFPLNHYFCLLMYECFNAHFFSQK